jgi:hypothetical protein
MHDERKLNARFEKEAQEEALARCGVNVGFDLMIAHDD